MEHPKRERVKKMSRKTGYIFEKEISDTLKKENMWHFKFVETRTLKQIISIT